MSKLIRVLLVVGVVIAALIAVQAWRNRGESAESAVLEVYGNIDVRQVELAFNQTELVGEVLAEEGDRVKRGDLLATLELERFELAVAKAEAQVQSQQQVVARFENGSRPEEIAKAKAEYEAAKAALDELERTYQRNLKLAQQDAISQQVLDDSRAAAETARARAGAAKAALDLVLAGPRKEDIAQAKAVLRLYEAALAQAKHELKDAHLYAPSDGVIQERILEVGDTATPLRPVFTLALVDPVWVRAYVSEPDLGKISEGMPAKVISDSFPDREYDAWIGFISPTAEFTPKPVETRELRTKLVYQIRVFVRNPRNELRLGMPVSVKIAWAEHRSDQGEQADGDEQSDEP